MQSRVPARLSQEWKGKVSHPAPQILQLQSNGSRCLPQQLCYVQQGPNQRASALATLAHRKVSRFRGGSHTLQIPTPTRGHLLRELPQSSTASQAGSPHGLHCRCLCLFVDRLWAFQSTKWQQFLRLQLVWVTILHFPEPSTDGCHLFRRVHPDGRGRGAFNLGEKN